MHPLALIVSGLYDVANFPITSIPQAYKSPSVTITIPQLGHCHAGPNSIYTKWSSLMTVPHPLAIILWYGKPPQTSYTVGSIINGYWAVIHWPGNVITQRITMMYTNVFLILLFSFMLPPLFIMSPKYVSLTQNNHIRIHIHCLDNLYYIILPSICSVYNLVCKRD